MMAIRKWLVAPSLLFVVAAEGAHARYYDASNGRFISADTVVPDAGDPQGFNRYAYVRNSPLVYVDPTGHSFEDLLRGATALFPTFAPSLTYNGWTNNVNSWQDLQRYSYQAAAWNGAIAFAGWSGVNAPSLAATAITESALSTGDGERFQERFGDEVFHDALGMNAGTSMFMSGLTLRLAGSAGLTYGFNSYNTSRAAQVARSSMFAEAAGDSVLDAGTIYYYPRPSVMTSNQVAHISFDSVLGAADFAAGWGDTVSMGGTAHVRSWLNIQSVDRTSIAYGAGEIGGMVNEAGLAIGGVAGVRPGGFLNSGPNLRIGWGKHEGRNVFRIAGDWIGKFKKNPHIDIFKGPRY